MRCPIMKRKYKDTPQPKASMHHISQESRQLLKNMPPEFAKTLGLMPLYRTFIDGVRATWADNPAAAEYLLDKVNAVYLRTDQPKGGRLRDQPVRVFEVMLSDAISRSELNARRESLRLNLALRGITCDDFRIGASKRGMLQRHPLKNLCAEKTPVTVASPKKQIPISEAEALAVLRRACVVVFGDRALPLASSLTGARVNPAALPTTEHRSARQWYFCDATVNSAAAEKELSASAEALRDKCFRLGLPLRKLTFRGPSH